MTDKTDLEQQAREVLRQCVRAHNAADEDNDVTIWPDMEPPIIAAILAFRDAQPGEVTKPVDEALRRALVASTEHVEALSTPQRRPPREAVLSEAAQVAYRICAETRHVTLGDKVRDAILSLLPTDDGSRDELERLRALAQRINGYASHSLACALYQRSWASGAPPCTCGLDEARAALGEPQGEEARG